MENKPKIVVAFSGGGSKGIFQANLYYQIAKDFNINPHAVAGVSVGALNGGMVATNRLNGLVKIWDEIKEEDVFKKRSLFNILAGFGIYKLGLKKAPLAAYDNSKLFELIQKEIHYEDLICDFKMGMVSLNTGEYQSQLKDESLFHEQILASTAIPVAFDPVNIDGEQWVDGGVKNVTPLADVLSYDPDLVIIMPTAPYPLQKKDGDEVKDILGVAIKSLELMMDEVFDNDIRRFEDINHMIKQAEDQGITLENRNSKPLKYYKSLILPPKINLGSPLDFDTNVMSMRKEHAFRVYEDDYKSKIEEAFDSLTN